MLRGGVKKDEEKTSNLFGQFIYMYIFLYNPRCLIGGPLFVGQTYFLRGLLLPHGDYRNGQTSKTDVLLVVPIISLSCHVVSGHARDDDYNSNLYHDVMSCLSCVWVTT